MTDNLIERLGDEADQCRNDGADDIAKLLDEARAAIEKDRERHGVPAGWKLVPIDLLKRAENSLGSFCSDHGWDAGDMETMDSISALLAASPQPSLWAIHAPGPDDYYPAPDEEAAKHMAAKHNAAMTEYYKANPDASGYRPPIECALATAAMWPGSAADHAEEVAVFDYAAWGLAAPQPQPVQPTNCRHCGGPENVLCAGQCRPAQGEKQ